MLKWSIVQASSHNDFIFWSFSVAPAENSTLRNNIVSSGFPELRTAAYRASNLKAPGGMGSSHAFQGNSVETDENLNSAEHGVAREHSTFAAKTSKHIPLGK